MLQIPPSPYSAEEKTKRNKGFLLFFITEKHLYNIFLRSWMQIQTISASFNGAGFSSLRIVLYVDKNAGSAFLSICHAFVSACRPASAIKNAVGKHLTCFFVAKPPETITVKILQQFSEFLDALREIMLKKRELKEQRDYCAIRVFV